jgi:hypothetical protein
MGRHSKNRTSHPTVSAQEKASWTEYGSKRMRLGGESFLGFDACVLCLQRARSPIKICDSGHVYCNVSSPACLSHFGGPFLAGMRSAEFAVPKEGHQAPSGDG